MKRLTVFILIVTAGCGANRNTAQHAERVGEEKMSAQPSVFRVVSSYDAVTGTLELCYIPERNQRVSLKDVALVTSGVTESTGVAGSKAVGLKPNEWQKQRIIGGVLRVDEPSIGRYKILASRSLILSNVKAMRDLVKFHVEAIDIRKWKSLQANTITIYPPPDVRVDIEPAASSGIMAR